jgi:transposase
MAAFDAGEPARAVAARFAVRVSFICKADLRRRRIGDSRAGVQRCRMPLRLEPYRDAIMSHIRQQPDATMAAVQGWLVREHGVRVALATIWKTLGRFGLTFEKSHSGRPSRTAPMLRRPERSGASSSLA